MNKRIAKSLEEYGINVELASNESTDVFSLAEKQNAVVVSTSNVRQDSPQQNFVQNLLQSGKPVIVVAVRNPYDIAAFPEVDAYLATYSTHPKSLDAAVDIIVGELNPTGKLPVEIPGLYPFGLGLRG
ncbi:menaquinone-dependent protoporphyrinogen IX oxidase [Ammoniphilus resinae]|uniref:Menaquinone-dependent protoporphyrinogen IX oxidase n=1 Tax=Ammoniphilus resinae TaxID=861532 RepID=A0ABS4GPI9_9BACL|nr:menaquinone-dependent protoporphyrinogen IX oxidase [Ammoniphilus resinae]